MLLESSDAKQSLETKKSGGSGTASDDAALTKEDAVEYCYQPVVPSSILTLVKCELSSARPIGPRAVFLASDQTGCRPVRGIHCASGRATPTSPLKLNLDQLSVNKLPVDMLTRDSDSEAETSPKVGLTQGLGGNRRFRRRKEMVPVDASSKQGVRIDNVFLTNSRNNTLRE